ncbi:hypothetical protein [Cobetia sp. MB87]|uniref:hypothetical protein n=1 Tax=Cobetia sp. MB87 TaxID=2588451 RepID=UPI0014085367|nr:hypothetical protein [Cobetia sp. MB87]
MAALITTAWAWGRKLISGLKIEVILMAVVLGWGAMKTYEATKAEQHANDLKAELSTEKAVNRGLEMMALHYGNQMKRLSVALEAREASRALDDRSIMAARAAARRMERDDAPTGDWADRPVPDAAAEWLQRLREQASGNAN